MTQTARSKPDSAKARADQGTAGEVGAAVGLQPGERTDIRTIARLANVSIATVSRVMNGVPTVNAEMARRVWEIVEELDFVPNTQARALVSGRSRIFGLLISEITNPFFPELIQGFEDVAIEHGYEILVSSTNYDPRRMTHCIRRMVERKVEGVAVMTFGIEEPLLDQLANRQVPLVFIDIGPDRPDITLLKVDYRRGIHQAVEHLVRLGHSRIGFVSGPRHVHSANSRLNAFSSAMGLAGLSTRPEWILEGDHTMEGGVAATERFLAHPERPTALLCSNDMTAIGVMHTAWRAGLKVPQDLSVIGFDDIHLAAMMMPPLTTVQMSRYDLARAAFQALRAHAEEPEKITSRQEIVIPTELILRESTAPPAK